MSNQTTNKLSLKQIESTGLINWLNDKEIEKAVVDALQEQRELLNTPKKKLDTLDYILANGGKTKIEYNGEKYSVSCLTPEQLQHKDNLSAVAVKPPALGGGYKATKLLQSISH